MPTQLQLRPVHDALGPPRGSYRKPDLAWFNKKTKMSQETWESNMKEMEDIQKEVEGDDDRQYVAAETKKRN
ncbi:C-5 sterol desaturase [Colletotrichum tofieldiae]|nr:C-5 sterol desaturase [Colletotrichum tofieldiae]